MKKAFTESMRYDELEKSQNWTFYANDLLASTRYNRWKTMLEHFKDFRQSLSYRLIFMMGLTLFVSFSTWAYFRIKYQKDKAVKVIKAREIFVPLTMKTVDRLLSFPSPEHRTHNREPLIYWQNNPFTTFCSQ